MKIVSVLLLLIIFTSCEESFKPQAEFVEEYSMFGVFSASDSSQILTLQKSYPQSPFVDINNALNNDIRGATVLMITDDSTFVLEEKDVGSEEIGEYSPRHYYLANNIRLDKSSSLRVEAHITDGPVLSADIIIFHLEKVYLFHESTQLIEEDQNLEFRFTAPLSPDEFEEILILPKVTIEYSKNDEGNSVIYEKEVPLFYNARTGTPVEVLPEITSNKYLKISNKTFITALSLIESEETQRANIKIHNARIQLFAFDSNLGLYFSSISSFVNNFSLKLNPTDISNVEGGRGIVGIYEKVFDDKLLISRNIIRNLGFSF